MSVGFAMSKVVLKLLLACACVVFGGSLSRPRLARADDPLLGPSTHATPRARWQPRSVFTEVIEDVEDRLVNTRRPGMPEMIGPPRTAVVRRDVLTRIDDRPLRFLRGVQVRRSGGADQVLGPALPVDLVSGVLAGTLLAFRVGLEGGLIGAYGIAGGGTFTTFHHGAGRRDDPIVITTRSSPYGFVGLGAELRVHRTLLVAAELDWGRLATGSAEERLMAPAPTETVRTAVFALRVDY